MEHSIQAPFNVDVSRPLSERGHVRAGRTPAPSPDPARQIERRKEQLARDIALARRELKSIEREARHRARNVAVAAVALIAVGLAVRAVQAVQRRRRHVWRRALRSM